MSVAVIVVLDSPFPPWRLKGLVDMDWVLAGDRDRHRCWDWLRSPAFGGAEVPVPVGESGYQGPGQASAAGGLRQRRGSGASPWWRLVAVVVGLVGSLDGDAEVFGLVV